MGADRYSVCPRCQSRKDRQVEENAAQLETAYGKLPLAEFDQLRERIETFAADPLAATLREDYEFVSPVDDGFLGIRYKARCQDCSLEVRIDETRQLWTPEELNS